MAKESTKKSTVSKKANETKNKKTVSKKGATKTEVKKVVKTPVETKKVKEEVAAKAVVPVEVKKTTVSKKSFIQIIKDNIYLVMLCTVCVLLIINIIIVVAGNKVELKDGKEVVASIDGLDITAEDLFDQLKESYGAASVVSMVDEYIVDNEEVDEDAVTKYAEEQLSSVKSYYEAQGSTWTDILKTYGYASEEVLLEEIKANYRKQLIVNNYLADKVTDEEINTYYAENIYGDYNAKHILITPETTDDMTDDQVTAANEAAKATALEVIAKLNNGEDWATLVTTYSDDSGSVDTAGLVENFTNGDVEDNFFSAVLELSDGEYTTTPVETTYGYHIILKVSNTEKPALEDVKESIIEAIVADKLSDDDTLYDTTWVAIREDNKLTINDTIVSKAYKASIAE